MSTNSPLVSIVLPTYNRLTFLPAAIQSIRDQEFTDWELVIVDDGSTDATLEHLPELTKEIDQPIYVIQQENQGAYGARNTGLQKASGKFLAFFDSDDLWRPYHLKDCVDALVNHEQVDWVYGACKLIDTVHSKVVSENSFYEDGQRRAFMNLPHRRTGQLNIITVNPESAACCQIQHGFYSGLQNSVIRRTVFSDYHFEAELRNEAEDQIAVIRTVLAGHTFAYFDKVHVDYSIHLENSSSAGSEINLEKKERVTKAMIAGFEALLPDLQAFPIAKKSLRQHLSNLYFWNLGYVIYGNQKNKQRQRDSFLTGLRLSPISTTKWKTLLIKCF
ncbi:glycosyltransferase family 2 protein [Rubripirellula sp.]|nr:glycosyltransferase family 2 protein [Rubripirellula sp.]MDB4621385.1 glycosyltransferase family 2 protein [Rubripirellula sp.]